MKKYDIGLGLVFILIGTAMFINAGTLPPAESGIGSGFWPRVLAVLLLILSVILICGAFFSSRGAGKDGGVEASPVDFHSAGVRRVLMAAIILAAFFGIMYMLGFLIAAAFLIPAIMILMGEKRIPVLVLMTLSVVVLVYVIFVMILSLPLPSGQLF